MTTDLSRVATGRFERYLSAVVAVVAVAWTPPTLDSLFADLPGIPGPPGQAIVALVLASVLTGVVAAVAHRWSTVLLRVGFLLYVVALAIWPFALTAPVPVSPMPWFVAMWPVQAIFLAAGHRLIRTTIGISLAATVPVGLVLLQIGAMPPAGVLMQCLYLIGCGGVFSVLLGALRGAIADAEQAEQVAASRFVETKRDGAEELERARTDALVHDCVLTTLLSAGSAGTEAEDDLSRRMAANALRVLGHVNRSAEHGAAVPFGQALAELRKRFGPVLTRFDLSTTGTEDLMLPAHVADSLLAAMVEVLQSSVEADAARSIRARALGPDGIRITVRNGAGSTVQESVADRMRSIDGRAEVAEGADGGSVVTLSWGSVVITGTAPRIEAEMTAA